MPTPRNRGSLCRHHKCHIIVLCVLLIACAIYGLSCPERTSAFRFFARNLIQLKNIIQFIYLLLKILYFYTISIFIGSLQWSDRPLALYLHFVISWKYENFEKYYQYIFHLPLKACRALSSIRSTANIFRLSKQKELEKKALLSVSMIIRIVNDYSNLNWFPVPIFKLPGRIVQVWQ